MGVPEPPECFTAICAARAAGVGEATPRMGIRLPTSEVRTVRDAGDIVPVMPTEQQVLDALRGIRDPESQKDIVALGLVRDLAIDASGVSVTLAFTGQPPATKATIHSMATRLLGQIPGIGR